MKQTEYDLQVQCVLYLEQLKNQGRIDLFTSIPNSTFVAETKFKTKNGFDLGKKRILDKNRESGVRSGLCDLLILINGIPYFIELKTLTGTLQETQKEWIKTLNKRFMLAYIACSFEEFCLLVEDCIQSSLVEMSFEDTNYAKKSLKGYKMLKKLL